MPIARSPLPSGQPQVNQFIISIRIATNASQTTPARHQWSFLFVERAHEGERMKRKIVIGIDYMLIKRKIMATH